MIIVLVKHKIYVENSHALLDNDYYMTKGTVVEVENLTDLNDKFKYIEDIKILKQ